MDVFHVQATDVVERSRQGLIGALSRTDEHNRTDTLWNKDPQAAQVDTVTVDNDIVDTTYSYVIQGVTISFTSGNPTGGPAAIAAGLAAAHNADFVASSIAYATAAGAVVTLTGQDQGVSYTVSDTDANLTTALSSAAATADPVPFGRALVDDGGPASGEATRNAKLAQASAFTAQAIDGTVTFVTGANYTVTVKDACTGEVIAQVSEAADTDSATTAQNIQGALNSALPANTVDVTISTNVLTFTAEVAGYEFEVSGTGPDGGIVYGNATGPSAATSLCRAFAGFALRSRNDAALTVGATESQYEANKGMRVLKWGWMYAERTEAVAYGGPVYVELAAGDNAGKLYTTASATRVRLPSSLAVWERDGFRTSDNVAEVRLALQP